MKPEELNFLVIEDDDFQRRMIVQMLRTLGAAEIREAGNGRLALEILNGLEHKPVDIALCDMDMPEMDGMEFMRHLGQKQEDIAILILSTLDRALLTSIETMSKAYGISLLGVIEKPIALTQLELLIFKFERPHKKRRDPIVSADSFSLADILHGVSEKQFEPYFQPKVDMSTEKIVGAEALARWIHPDHGVIEPYAFIPLLEQNNSIDELTFSILEKSAAACRLCLDKNLMLTVSVNLSLVSLNDTDLARNITTIVRNSGLNPRHMILEITESAVMTDLAHALENLARLRMHGFGLSIDDYGTGYSTMQQLTRIAFSELKIDQSFVRNFDYNEASRIVVESSIDVARKLRVKSVAEGIETQQEWDTLKSMGCDIAQGYLVARPMNLAAFMQFCETHSA